MRNRDQDIVYKKPRGQFYSGDFDPMQHRVVVLDDFEGKIVEETLRFLIQSTGSHMSYGEWKEMCDEYQHRVQIKGDFMPFLATLILITTTVRPDEWWSAKHDFREISRRVERWIVYDSRDKQTHYYGWDDIGPPINDPLDADRVVFGCARDHVYQILPSRSVASGPKAMGYDDDQPKHFDFV